MRLGRARPPYNRPFHRLLPERLNRAVAQTRRAEPGNVRGCGDASNFASVFERGSKRFVYEDGLVAGEGLFCFGQVSAGVYAFDQNAIDAATHVRDLVHEPHAELVTKLGGIFVDTAAALLYVPATTLVSNYNGCPIYRPIIHGIGEGDHVRGISTHNAQTEA